MELTDSDCSSFIAILEEELVPALGCTEPIAIAYAGAHARRLLRQSVLSAARATRGLKFLPI